MNHEAFDKWWEEEAPVPSHQKPGKAYTADDVEAAERVAAREGYEQGYNQALDQIKLLIRSDSHAIGFQTLGQYRGSLLDYIKRLKE